MVQTQDQMWLQEIRRYWSALMQAQETLPTPAPPRLQLGVESGAANAGVDVPATKYSCGSDIACTARVQRPGAGRGRQVPTMDARIQQFVSEHARNLIGLDIALFFQANPKTFDTAEGLARRTHRDVEQVAAALDRLAEGGVLEVFSRGEGRYKCYALAKSRSVWSLLCLLSEAYIDDLESRKEIVRMLIRARTEDKRTRQGPENSQ